MENVSYYLINAQILPETFKKVIKAKNLLASGEAQNASQAAKMAGVSRSAYYKYKDAVFEYHADTDADTASINAKLRDNAGVLSALMGEIYRAGANVLSVNQGVPVNSVADVSVTVRIAEMTASKDELLDKINAIGGIISAELS